MSTCLRLLRTRTMAHITLGIESSCDETGLALYEYERGLLGHVLHSQIALHRDYGGVVPELASRDHVRYAAPLLEQLLADTQIELSQISAIAYTRGPGLGGALLIGAGLANGLGRALDIPTLGIHHLEGHLLSPQLSTPAPDFPFVALLVSGGHTQLMRVDDIGHYTLLGETLDDAAGEAFDKTAKLLGLDYPGGPLLAKLATEGRPGQFKFPRPMLHSGDFDFSFSGLKTAVLTQVRQVEPDDAARADIAWATQDAIIDVLVHKSLAALAHCGLNTLVVAGGVGANAQLRERLNSQALARGLRVFYPDLAYCTDNGAMIAFAGSLRFARGEGGKDYRFDIKPRWDLQEISQPS